MIGPGSDKNRCETIWFLCRFWTLVTFEVQARNLTTQLWFLVYLMCKLRENWFVTLRLEKICYKFSVCWDIFDIFHLIFVWTKKMILYRQSCCCCCWRSSRGRWWWLMVQIILGTMRMVQARHLLSYAQTAPAVIHPQPRSPTSPTSSSPPPPSSSAMVFSQELATCEK